MPHDVRLRMAVQQQQRHTLPAHPAVQTHTGMVNVENGKLLQHGLHCALLAAFHQAKIRQLVIAKKDVVPSVITTCLSALESRVGGALPR